MSPLFTVQPTTCIHLNLRLSKHENLLIFSIAGFDIVAAEMIGHCSGIVHMCAQVCVCLCRSLGWVCRLRSNKAVENPGLGRERGEQGRAIELLHQSIVLTRAARGTVAATL